MLSHGMENISSLVTALFRIQSLSNKGYSRPVIQVFDYFRVRPQCIQIRFSKGRMTGDILPSTEGTSTEETISFFCVTEVMEGLAQDYL